MCVCDIRRQFPGCVFLWSSPPVSFRIRTHMTSSQPVKSSFHADATLRKVWESLRIYGTTFTPPSCHVCSFVLPWNFVLRWQALVSVVGKVRYGGVRESDVTRARRNMHIWTFAEIYFRIRRQVYARIMNTRWICCLDVCGDRCLWYCLRIHINWYANND